MHIPVLSACGGGGGATTSTASTIDGDWRACVAKGADSGQFLISLKGGLVEQIITAKHTGDTTCGNNPQSYSLNASEFNYSFGDTVTVDGSVEGITTATELNCGLNSSSTSCGELSLFSIFALKDGKLLFGDDTGANDGTTDATRPTTLGDFAFVKQ